MSDFCFIIPSYCKTYAHTILLRTCVDRIRKYHDNQIYIINDFSSEDLDHAVEGYSDVTVLLSQAKGVGEILPYMHFKSLDFERAVIMHDSMFLETALEGVDDIWTMRHLWHFTNHRLQWHTIKEPVSDYNTQHGIVTHDDLILHRINNDIKNSSFKEWLLHIYLAKQSWSGSFGCQSIMTKSFLNHLEEKTNIIDTLSKYTAKRDRMVSESLFALACQYCTAKQASELSYDGLYYDGVNTQQGRTRSVICKKKYFSKVTMGR